MKGAERQARYRAAQGLVSIDVPRRVLELLGKLRRSTGLSSFALIEKGLVILSVPPSSATTLAGIAGPSLDVPGHAHERASIGKVAPQMSPGDKKKRGARKAVAVPGQPNLFSDLPDT